ncbi:hypothetical protein [Halocatena halophila]|uniref:hypothetical protein n=1 Tax=Halocatena halophila TaxID=2814576 RepID=UPI002ED05CD6
MGSSLIYDAVHRLRGSPETVAVGLGAGLFIQGLDRLLQESPIAHMAARSFSAAPPTVSVQLISQVTFSRPALMGLEPTWQLWALWLLLLEYSVTIGCGGWLFARLRGVSLSPKGLVRYGLLTVPSWIVLPYTPGPVWTALSTTITICGFALLFVLPGLLIEGIPFSRAIPMSVTVTRRSWLSVVGATLVVLGGYQLAAMDTRSGPMLSAVVGVVHASLVAGFLAHTE